MLDKLRLEESLTSNDKKTVIDALMEMVFNADVIEIKWVVEKLIDLTTHSDEDVRGLAVTSFGHVARLYHTLGHYNRVTNLLEQIKNDPLIGGRAQDALEDIEIYLRE